MINTPQRFKDGLDKKVSTIYPIVIIQKGDNIIRLSQKKGLFDGEYYEDRFLKVNSINEKIDIQEKKFQVNQVRVQVSNYIINQIRFSEKFASFSFANSEASIYYSNANCKGLDDCLLVFKGFVSDCKGGSSKLVIKIEDLPQNILEEKSLPRYKTYDASQETIERSKTAFFPITYGHNEKAPLLYTRSNKSGTVSEIYPDSVFRDDIQIEGFERYEIADANGYETAKDYSLSIFREDQYHGIPDKIFNLPTGYIINGKDYGFSGTGYNETTQYEFSQNNDVLISSKRIQDERYSQGLRPSLQSREQFLCRTRRAPSGASADSSDEMEWSTPNESITYMGPSQNYEVERPIDEEGTFFTFPKQGEYSSSVEQGFYKNMKVSSLTWAYTGIGQQFGEPAEGYYTDTARPIFYLGYLLQRIGNASTDGRKGFDYCYRPDPEEIRPFLKDEYQGSEIMWSVDANGLPEETHISEGYWEGRLSYWDALSTDPSLVQVPSLNDEQSGDTITSATDGLIIDGNNILLDSPNASDYFKPGVTDWANNEGDLNPSLRKILWGRRVNFGQGDTADEVGGIFQVGTWVYGLFPTLGYNRIIDVYNTGNGYSNGLNWTYAKNATLRFDSLYSFKNPYLTNPEDPLSYEGFETLTQSLSRFNYSQYNFGGKLVIMPHFSSGHNEGWPMLYSEGQGNLSSLGKVATDFSNWCPIHFHESQYQMAKLNLTFNSVSDDDVIEGSVLSYVRGNILCRFAKTQVTGNPTIQQFNGHTYLRVECDAFENSEGLFNNPAAVLFANDMEEAPLSSFNELGEPEPYFELSVGNNRGTDFAPLEESQQDFAYDDSSYMYHPTTAYQEEEVDQWRNSLNAVGTISFTYYVHNSDPSTFTELMMQTDLINFELIQSFIIQNASKQKYFGNVRGRIDDAVGTYTGLESPHSLIEKPTDVFYHIMEKELGYYGQEVSGIDRARSLHENWKFAFSINEEIGSKDFIKDFSQSSKFIPRLRSDGSLSFINIPENDDFEFSIIESKDVISFSYSKTPVSDIKLMVNVSYNYDMGLEEYQANTNKNNGGAVPKDLNQLMDIYGINNLDDVFLKFESKYIRDEQTAINLRNYLLEWFKNQHNIIECTLPVTYINLECGDIVSFDSLIQDTKIFGRDYTQQYTVHEEDFAQVVLPRFFVQEITKSQNNIKLKLVQIHRHSNQDILNNNSLVEDYTGFYIDSEADAGNEQTTEILLGDWNQDGFVDILDVVGMVNYIVNVQEGADYLQQLAGDVNQDGFLNILDIVPLVSAIVDDEQLGVIEV